MPLSMLYRIYAYSSYIVCCFEFIFGPHVACSIMRGIFYHEIGDLDLTTGKSPKVNTTDLDSSYLQCIPTVPLLNAVNETS